MSSLHNIEKLPSGFFAYTWADTGAIIRADLVVWDGKRGTSFPYSVDGTETAYYIDAENNVYYSVPGGNTGIWCGASRLNSHCHRLAQIAARH